MPTYSQLNAVSHQACYNGITMHSYVSADGEQVSNFLHQVDFVAGQFAVLKLVQGHKKDSCGCSQRATGALVSFKHWRPCMHSVILHLPSSQEPVVSMQHIVYFLYCIAEVHFGTTLHVHQLHCLDSSPAQLGGCSNTLT